MSDWNEFHKAFMCTKAERVDPVQLYGCADFRKPAMLGNIGSMAGSITLQELNSYRFIYPSIRKSCLYCKSSHSEERCPNCGASEYE